MLPGESCILDVILPERGVRHENSESTLSGVFPQNAFLWEEG
jgi:hypothetical protein